MPVLKARLNGDCTSALKNVAHVMFELCQTDEGTYWLI